MSDRPELLFYGSNLSDVLRANLESAKRDVDQIPETQFRHSSDSDIVEHVYSKREVIRARCCSSSFRRFCREPQERARQQSDH